MDICSSLWSCLITCSRYTISCFHLSFLQITLVLPTIKYLASQTPFLIVHLISSSILSTLVVLSGMVQLILELFLVQFQSQNPLLCGNPSSSFKNTSEKSLTTGTFVTPGLIFNVSMMLAKYASHPSLISWKAMVVEIKHTEIVFLSLLLTLSFLAPKSQ